MVTLSPSSGHILLIYFQRKSFSNAGFMDLTSSTDPLEIFQVEFLHWMCFGRRVGLEICSNLFWDSDFFFECLC